MRLGLRILAGTAVSLFYGFTPQAQEHASHGGGFHTPLSPPPLLHNIGSSEIKITTRSAAAQRYFNQGLRLLHCFWDFEAYRAFREAARLDESAAMAHWGIYMALGQNAGEMSAARKEALARAMTLAPAASEVEQMYIRAAAASDKDGRAAYIREIELLIDRYPQEVDAQLFLARTLSAAPGSYDPEGRPRDGKVYGQMILQGLLAKYPHNAAVHHYWIHAVENGPDPGRALESAAKLPRLAPNSGHMVHMAGHIYYRLGDFVKARAAFEHAERVDAAYMSEQNISAVDNWNYVHNLDYLIGNCAEDGRYQDGLRRARQLAAVSVEASRRMANGLGYIQYGGYTAEARLHFRYGRWKEAAQSLDALLQRNAGESALVRGYFRALLSYALGRAAVQAGNPPQAEAHLAELGSVIATLAREKAQLSSDWYFGHARRIIEVAELDLRGALLGAQGRPAEAIAVLQDGVRKDRELGYWEPPHYARPVLETLADVYLAAGDTQSAIATYEKVLRLRPNSGHALLGIARAHARAGRLPEARAAYAGFLEAWKNADPTLDALREARDQTRANRPAAEKRNSSF